MSKKVVVEGDVQVRNSSGGNDLEFYEEEFLLDDSVSDAGSARQLIRRGLITQRLQKQVKNFKRVRTMQVVSFEDSKAAPEASDLDKLLTEAVKLQCVPQNIDNYKRTDYKMKALEKSIEAEKARRAKKKKPSNVVDEGYVD